MTDTKKAPDLNIGLGWLNTDKPLRFESELAGRIVVLDFWTYCCIDCMHILPDLAALEEKYKNDPVVFVGVHSAKFANETSRETIRSAILRYEIAHPVVIDDAMRIWRAYGARSWPTLFVIDSTGNIALQTAGQNVRETLDQAIGHGLEQGRAAGTLAGGPLKLKREASVRSASGLMFPGKVLADKESNRLFVADSNHNRIVIAEMPNAQGRAKVIKIVGSGEPGQSDGPADTATFDHPQGLAVALGNLYVADTENHLIREIDLETFGVSTVVGTGQMEWDRAGGGMGVQQGLNSPWDLTSEGSTLYVAMAGCHQIWRVDLPVGFARAFAGTGRENLVDGPTETAALSQPSGICAMGGKLYFADSEVSAIRGVDMASELVFTIVGEGLFSFGDVDGVHPKAKLQHPLGVDAWGTSLIVADTYNHKLKQVDPGGRSVRTLFGTGAPDATNDDGGVAFFEPGGVSVVGDEVFVSDTNNHRIVRVHLESGEWREINLEGLSAPAARGPIAAPPVESAAVSVTSGSELQLELDLLLPDGAELNGDAPWSVRVGCGDASLLQQTGKGGNLPLRAVVSSDSVRDGVWEIRAAFVYCLDGDGGMCVPGEVAWTVGISMDGSTSCLRLSSCVAAPA